MKKVAIIPPGTLPLPPVRGGAVENLIDVVRQSNKQSKNVELTLFSVAESAAVHAARSNKQTKYVFVKIPAVIRGMDRLIFWLAARVLHKQKTMSYRYIMQRLYYIYWIAAYLRRHDFDRVILENHGTLLWIMRLFHNDVKYAGHYYYHMHNTVPNFYHCRDIMKKCAAIIGVSNYILSTLPDDVRTVAKCVVLRNRVDERRFQHSVSEEQLETYRRRFQLAGKKVVLFTGRFSPEKGPKQLLMAWEKLRPKDAVLLIVGGAYYKSDIRTDFEREMAQLAASMHDSVRLTGFIPYQEMPALYALADLVVLPSIWDDPAPLTVIETLTAGKQLITTDSGGIPEYVNDSTIVLKRDDQLVNNLAAAIHSCLIHPKTLTSNKWRFSDYYQRLLTILEIK